MLSLNANSCRTFLALIEKLMPDGSAIIKLKKQDQLRINRIQEYENTNEGDIELYRFALVPPKGQGSRESIRLFFIDNRTGHDPGNITVIPNSVRFAESNTFTLISYIGGRDIVFVSHQEDYPGRLDRWFANLERLGYTY